MTTQNFMMDEKEAEELIYKIVLGESKEDYVPEFQEEVMAAIRRIREAI